MNQIGSEYKKKFQLFLVTFTVASLCIGLANVYFNTYGLFSNYQLDYKIVHNDRLSKYEWVKSLEITPECYIFGSSNSMRMSPDSLSSLTKLETFNFGLFHARVEDYWCMTNALLNGLKVRPKLIFFCLDDWNFSNESAPKDEIFRGAEKRLSYKSEYSKYLDDFSILKLRWGQLKSALTYEHLEGSVNAMKEVLSGNCELKKSLPSMTDVFTENGIRKKYGRIDVENIDITDTCETGMYNVTNYLKEVDSLWRLHPKTKNGILDKSHENFSWLSYRRLALFERTISLLEKNNCKVAINIMPNQPYFKKIIESQTNYSLRLKYFKGYLYYLQQKYSNIIVIKDNSDIKNFNGFENHFFDYMHPTSVNSNLMIETFRNELEVYAF